MIKIEKGQKCELELGNKVPSLNHHDMEEFK